LLRTPRILLRRHALRFQESCYGVAPSLARQSGAKKLSKSTTNNRCKI